MIERDMWNYVIQNSFNQRIISLFVGDVGLGLVLHQRNDWHLQINLISNQHIYSSLHFYYYSLMEAFPLWWR